MITFKEFLIEETLIKKEWDITNITTAKKLENLLNANCKEALVAWDNGNILYRGMNFPSNAALIDTTNSHRTSRDTYNLYQLMLDETYSLKDYPSRSTSIICGTSKDVANQYASSGLYRIIPYDGTKICYSSVKDFVYRARLNGKETLADLDEGLSAILQIFGFGISKQSNKYTDPDILNENFANYDDELLIFALAYNSYGVMSFRFFKGDLLNLYLKYFSEQFNINNISKMKNTDSYKDFITDISKNLNTNGKKLLSLFNSNQSKKFTALSNYLMSPSALKLSLGSITGGFKKNVECWFTGKCIAYTMQEEDTKFHISVENGKWKVV